MSKAEELSKLFELKKQGILTEEEFNKEKAKVLAADSGAPAVAAAPAVQAAPLAGGHGHIQAATNFASSNLIQLSCPKCKGEVQFLPGLDVVRCTFCGHEASVGASEATTVRVPNLIVPFKVMKEEAKRRFYNHLADDDFVPDSIFDDGTAIKVYGMFSPGYFFDGKYQGNWTALSIVKYTVKRGDKSHTEEQANPISGTVHGLFKQVVIASKLAGDASIDAEELRSRLKQYEPEYVQGFVVESLGTAKSQEACEVIARQHAQELASIEAVKMIPTSDYRNLAVNIDISANVFVFLQALWVCEIKHGGVDYRIWLPGDQSHGAISGTMPQDDGRKNLAEKLKAAGNNLYMIAVAICCGFCGWGLFDEEHGYKAWTFISDEGGRAILLPVISLLLAVPFIYKGWKKSRAGKAELDKILYASKQHRQDRIPSGIEKTKLTPPATHEAGGSGVTSNQFNNLKGKLNGLRDKINSLTAKKK